MSQLDPKIQEMIALGVAYALNCQKCMKVHKTMAQEVGLNPEEMSQAISVAESIKSGAHKVAKDAIKEIFGKEVEDARCCPIGSECCP